MSKNPTKTAMDLARTLNACGLLYQAGDREMSEALLQGAAATIDSHYAPLVEALRFVLNDLRCESIDPTIPTRYWIRGKVVDAVRNALAEMEETT